MDVEGKGTLYNGLLDAFVKIIRTEGLIGLYKGIFPTWMRIAPHTVLCLVFYEKLDQLYYNIFQNQHIIKFFKYVGRKNFIIFKLLYKVQYNMKK